MTGGNGLCCVLEGLLSFVVILYFSDDTLS